MTGGDYREQVSRTSSSAHPGLKGIDRSHRGHPFGVQPATPQPRCEGLGPRHSGALRGLAQIPRLHPPCAPGWA